MSIMYFPQYAAENASNCEILNQRKAVFFQCILGALFSESKLKKV